MSTALYWLAGLLVAVSCGLGLYAWRTRDRDDPAPGGAFFHRQPTTEDYERVLARRAEDRDEREQRAAATWETFAGPHATTGGIVTARMPSQAEVEAWLGYVPSWQAETASTGVLPTGDGTRLVTRYAGAVERYRQGGGSLGELLAEMDLLTAQHIRAVDDQPESPGEALALAGGERMNPTRPDISWDD
jgi:hypothetical protein